MDRPRPFPAKFIVVLISGILIGCYVMNQGHKGKLLMPSSKSARIAHPDEDDPQPAPQRYVAPGSKSAAIVREGPVLYGDGADATTQPATAQP
jgi:hypothetical protein